MNSERFKHLQELIGYDNEHMAKMLNIPVSEVEAYRTGSKLVPEKQAHDLELFADWSMEVGDTAVKKELAKKHLGRSCDVGREGSDEGAATGQ